MLSKSEIRENFRSSCLKRDLFSCVVCRTRKYSKEDLDVHHITDRNEMPQGGYVLENGITLCPPCHLKAEFYHISKGWDWVPGYHPNSLYFRIGSSRELAVQASTEQLG